MLRQLLSYTAVAFLVQIVTGVLTKLVELFVVAEILSQAELGAYRHFLLVLEVTAGLFIVGMDHSLVTYIHARVGNLGRYLRFLFLYGGTVAAVFGLAALALKGRVSAPTILALVAVGPFVFMELGKIVFRSRLEKRAEFGFLLFQSLTWSLGCLVVLPRVQNELVPIWCALAGTIPGAVMMAWIFARRSRRENGDGPAPLRPFGADYTSLWRSWRPLWVAGLAFLGNQHVVNIVVDRSMTRADFGRWGFVLTALTLLQRPLLIVQRATLPIFSAAKEQIPDGFRKLVRINLLLFPLLCLGVLTVWPLILSYGTLGEKYGDTWIYLALPVAVIPVMAVEFLAATASMALGHPKNNRDAHVLTVLINVPCSILLIGHYGILGAALATALYVVIFASMIFRFVARDLPDLVGFAVARLAPSLLGLWSAIYAMNVLGRPQVWGWVMMPAYVLWARIVGLWSPSQLIWVWRRIRRR